MWTLLGAFLFGIGPIVAVAYFISDVNQFAGVFGYVQPLPYTIDQAQRAIMASNGAFAYQQEQMYYDDNQQEQMYYDPTQQEQMLYGATQQGPASYAADAVPEYAEQNQIPNSFPEQNIPVQANHVDSSKATNRRVSHTGVIRGIAGMYDGYDFPIENNEEISIGTDPALASIVIDVNNEYISPKHCAIIFDANTDSYLVHDNSEYGTYSVESGRIMQGMPKQFGRGEQIYLGDERNVFRLG